MSRNILAASEDIVTTVRFDFRRIGLLLVLLSIGLSVSFLLFHRQIIGVFERNLSSDHALTERGQQELIAAYYFGTGVLLALGLGLVKAQDARWRARVKEVVLGEPLSRCASIRPTPRSSLVISSVIGLVLIANLRYWTRYRLSIPYCIFYCKDRGLLDVFVPASMTLCAVLLGAASWRLWNVSRRTKARAALLAAYLSLMAFFLIYAGEETSWGQDLFRWQTPALFSGNTENQTNIHNYFNDYFDYGYMSLSLVLAVIFLSAWLEHRGRGLPFNRLILPHPSLIGLGLLIAFVALVWYREQELLEELMAVLVLFYSIRIFRFFRDRRFSIEAVSSPDDGG
jgi:hypothetical protein